VHFFRFLVLSTCALSAARADYATYVGDVFTYNVTAITTDSGGNSYVTESRVTVLGTQPLTDVVVSKLDTSGNVTLRATFGGREADQGNGIAVDPSGNI
jgi:hypothetical protein